MTNKKASELLLESATPFDNACLKVRRMETQLEEIHTLLHYPDCWDTVAYPTIQDAIKEIFYCTACANKESDIICKHDLQPMGSDDSEPLYYKCDKCNHVQGYR